MSYSNFTNEQIFKSTRINILCNRIFNSVTNAFPNIASTKFAVTGTLAKILNQDEAVVPLKVIAFITNDQDIFNYCHLTLPKEINGSAIKFKDRIQLKKDNVLLEVWLASALTTATSYTISTQRTADIPTNIN